MHAKCSRRDAQNKRLIHQTAFIFVKPKNLLRFSKCTTPPPSNCEKEKVLILATIWAKFRKDSLNSVKEKKSENQKNTKK